MKNKKKLSHIPGDTGNLIFGNTLNILKDPYKTSKENHARYGAVYKYKIFSQEIVALCGPEANELVLMDQDKIFSSKLGWQYIAGFFFKDGLPLRDFAEHKIHRKALQASFTSEKMANYIPILSKTVDQEISSLPSNGLVMFYPFIKNLILKGSATMLMGVDITADIEKINTAFIRILIACGSVIRLNIPGTPFHRGGKARAYMCDYLNQLIIEKTIQPGNDMLSNLINTEFEDGTKMSSEDIINHFMFALMAAHDTTATTVSGMLYAVAKYPEWQNKIYQQISELDIKNGEFSLEMLDKLDLLDLIMNESLRLYSPVQVLPRRAIKPFHYAGYDIPENTPVSLNVLLTHMLPNYWENPDQFDPERFNNERAEHKQHRFLHIPFGGGAHKCIGMKLAQFESKIIVAKLLMKYRFNVTGDYVAKFHIKPMLVPSDGLPLEIHER